jgi:hypothetical protein
VALTKEGTMSATLHRSGNHSTAGPDGSGPKGGQRPNTRPDDAGPGGRLLRWAWVSVAAIPVALVLAMLVGEGLISMLGYDPGSTTPVPPGAALTAAIPAILVMAAPGFLAVWLGSRALQLGEQRAVLPLVVGAVAALGGILLNVLAYLVGR